MMCGFLVNPTSFSQSTKRRFSFMVASGITILIAVGARFLPKTTSFGAIN